MHKNTDVFVETKVCMCVWCYLTNYKTKIYKKENFTGNQIMIKYVISIRYHDHMLYIIKIGMINVKEINNQISQ